MTIFEATKPTKKQYDNFCQNIGMDTAFYEQHNFTKRAVTIGKLFGLSGLDNYQIGYNLGLHILIAIKGGDK